MCTMNTYPSRMSEQLKLLTLGCIVHAGYVHYAAEVSLEIKHNIVRKA